MLPFVGPSYSLANRDASAQRTVNMYLVGMETPSKAPFILQSVEGLTLAFTLGAEVRGAIEVGTRCFVVAGTQLWELFSNGSKTALGTLTTSTGEVGMAIGTTQLVIVDGAHGYVLTLATNVFTAISDPDFPGASSVGYLDGFFTMITPNTQQFYVTGIDDAAAIDPLDFASAESSPDTLVTHLVSHREVILFGTNSIERWFNAGNADFPFSRDNGATSEVGIIAAHSAKAIDNGFMWIGRDKNGSGIVYRDVNRTPARVSTMAVEQALQASTDLSAATAWVYQKSGQTFYAINAPGVPATWVYEVSTNAWHERCELDDLGQFMAHRVTHHVFALGQHLVFDADGYGYTMSPSVYTFDEDPIKRSRTSPNDVTAARDRKTYSEFILDCTTGEAPQGVSPVAELSWSNDGGATFGNAVLRSIGEVGQRFPSVKWRRLGMARDRVWRVECSSNAPFSIIDGVAR